MGNVIPANGNTSRLMTDDEVKVAAHSRGMRDAERGIPPREGSISYLEGYVSVEKAVVRRPLGAGVESER